MIHNECSKLLTVIESNSGAFDTTRWAAQIMKTASFRIGNYSCEIASRFFLLLSINIGGSAVDVDDGEL